MLKIAITGASGLIGTRILEILGYKYVFIPIPQAQVDIVNKKSIEVFLEDKKFDFLLHLAAFTNVDGAEKNKQLCYDINVTGTKNISEVCKSKKAKMIHISTDFVFDGKEIDGKIPSFTEGSTPNPVSYYGQTKYEAEELVKDSAMIIRLSYPYRQKFDEKKDFVRTISDLLKDGKEVKMVDDSRITPTFIDDMAVALDHLIENYSPEIYHLVGADSMSPFEAGLKIARHFGLDSSLLKPISYEEYFKGKAKRPQYAIITNTKNIGISMKSFELGLKEL